MNKFEYGVVDDLPGVSDPDKVTPYNRYLCKTLGVKEMYNDRFHIQKRASEKFNHFDERYHELIIRGFREAIVRRSGAEEEMVDAAMLAGTLPTFTTTFRGTAYTIEGKQTGQDIADMKQSGLYHECFSKSPNVIVPELVRPLRMIVMKMSELRQRIMEAAFDVTERQTDGGTHTTYVPKLDSMKRTLVADVPTMESSLKNMLKRLPHVVPKLTNGVARPEWRVTGKKYLGFAVHMPLIKTSANESLHSSLGSMIDGSRVAPETATAIHLETRPAQRREVHAKRDHKEGKGDINAPQPAAHNRTDIVLNVIALHEACPMIGPAPVARPQLADVDTNALFLFSTRVGSLEGNHGNPIVPVAIARPVCKRPACTFVRSAVSFTPATGVGDQHGKRRRLDLSNSDEGTSSMPPEIGAAAVASVTGPLTTDTDNDSGGMEVDDAVSTASALARLVHPSTPTRRKPCDVSFKWPCTCCSGGKLQPNAVNTGVGRRSHTPGCPRHNTSPYRNLHAADPVHGDMVTVSFHSESGTALVYTKDSDTRQASGCGHRECILVTAF
eukprot:m.212405 g.212405  ORF g.212405 m.212405 type:complete len:555 (-) comp26109_c0_seq1:1-1665(-)